METKQPPCPGLIWSEQMETMSTEELRRHEAPLLARQVEYLYENSEYYRSQLDRAGIKPGDITCHDALENVPFTEKKDLALAQHEGALIGPHQCAPHEDIVRIVRHRRHQRQADAHRLDSRGYSRLQ